jgi:hypothetical protein
LCGHSQLRMLAVEWDMWGRDAPVQRITDIVGDADGKNSPGGLQ